MPAHADAPDTTKDLTLSHGREIIGRGQYLENSKQFLVRKGSRVRVAETNSIPSGIKTRRAELLKQGAVGQEGDFYRLKNDEVFSSISNAAGVLLGRSANGNQEWQPNSEIVRSTNRPETKAAVPTASTTSSNSSELAEAHTDLPRESTEAQTVLPSEPATGRSDEPTESVEIRQGREVVAHGKVKRTGPKPGTWNGSDHTGSITVLAGASFRADETASLSAPYRRLREELFDVPELFGDSGDGKSRRILKKNHEFSSLSASASAILGAQVNGRNAWNLSGNGASDKLGADDTPSYSKDPLGGLALHLGFLAGVEIEAGIRNGNKGHGFKWDKGPFPVPYIGNSRVANKSTIAGGTVDRRSAFPADASTLLSLKSKKSGESKPLTEQANCTRFHLDLRENPQQFEEAPTGELVTIVGIEALLDINSNKRRKKSKGPSAQTQPLVLTFHLDTDDDVFNGQLAQQLGLWLYGEEAVDFKRYLTTFIESVTGVKEVDKVVGDEMLSFVTLHVTQPNAGDLDPVDYRRLLSLASLGAPAIHEAPGRTTAEPGKFPLESDRLAEWNGTSSAVFKRSAMVIIHHSDSRESNTSATTAMEASSIYSDVVALAMLENLTLNMFLKKSQEVSNELLDKFYMNYDSNREQAALLGDLQRDYMANSASYGKLHIVMRASGGDVYRALRVRWRLASLRNDISEEITRLSEHVGTLAERSRESLEKANADQQRIRESTISTSLAFVAVIIGAPAISDFAFDLWGWNPLATFLGTFVGAVAVLCTVPSFIRRVENRRKMSGFSPLPSTNSSRRQIEKGE